MTSCERLSDRMVAIAHGHAAWTSDEARHLAACPDCGAEWRLVEQGVRLGAALPVLDAERVAGRVRARLAADATPGDPSVVPISGRRRWSRGGRWLVGLAAAAALVLAVRFGGGIGRGDGRSQLLTELDELSPPELELVLDDLESPGSPGEVGGLGDLDADELEQVLRSWES